MRSGQGRVSMPRDIVATLDSMIAERSLLKHALLDAC
jgi:hypothetical protein